MLRMFSSLNGSLVRHVLSSPMPPIMCQKVVWACRNYAVKPFKAQENSLVRNYQNSFQIWVLNLFKNDPNYSSFETPTVSDAQFDPSMDFDVILNFLWTKKAQEALTPLLLRKIDGVLNVKVSSNTSPEDMLKFLQICMTTVPIQAGKMESFKSAIVQFEDRIRKSELTPHDVVQTMYYASHLKSGILAKRFMQAVVYHLDVEKMESLSTTDLGIYCVSLFRCAVAVENAAILKFLESRFRRDIATLIGENSAIFVSFVKLFRLSKYYGEDLLGFVASQGLKKVLKCDVTARTHLAVWFAAAECSNVEYVQALLSSCVEDMTGNPRLKDINNLLWASASYGLPKVNDVIAKGYIPNYVSDRLCLARNDPHLQISLLTWLWMCDCRLERDVARYVAPETIKYIKGEN